MSAIIKREFKSLFNTMTAPIFTAVLIAVVGIYFWNFNVRAGYPYFAYSLSAALFVLLLTAPLLSMRSFSEDRRQKTDQILLTTPLSLGDIVFGKFFAMCLVLLIPVGVFCLCPLIIGASGTAFYGVDYASLFAFYVTGCFFLSVGMFISSLTESQVIAAVGSFAVLLLLYLWGDLMSIMPTAAPGTLLILLAVAALLCFLYYSSTKNWISSALVFAVAAALLIAIFYVKPAIYENFFTTYMSGFVIGDIFSNFSSYNLFDVAGIIKLLIATGVMIFLTSQSVMKRRWN